MNLHGFQGEQHHLELEEWLGTYPDRERGQTSLYKMTVLPWVASRGTIPLTSISSL